MIFFFNFEKFQEKKIPPKKNFASFFCSYVVSELAGRIEDSSFNRFALNGIPELPATLCFFGGEKTAGEKPGGEKT